MICIFDFTMRVNDSKIQGNINITQETSFAVTSYAGHTLDSDSDNRLIRS